MKCREASARDAHRTCSHSFRTLWPREFGISKRIGPDRHWHHPALVRRESRMSRAVRKRARQRRHEALDDSETPVPRLQEVPPAGVRRSRMRKLPRSFNGSPAFDKPTARNKWWSQGFSQLKEAGLVSAHHEFNGVTFGGEPHATHHFLRKPACPFHIDFCFVPRTWAEQQLDARIASGLEWSALSHHFPLIVDAGT